MSINAAYAARDAGALLIDNSYIVTFKASAPGAPGLIKAAAAKQERFAPHTQPKFGEHENGQSKDQLGASLGLRGKVASIFETISAAHIQMDAAEAARLSRHPAVLRVEQNKTMTAAATQIYPGWGLDRLDQTSTIGNQQYVYNADGTGQTVYVLDSGLDLANATVKDQFGGRASVLWDVNGGNGVDCNGHGTKVASAIAGKTHGVAKGAKLVIAKITSGCSKDSDAATIAFALDWLAKYAPRGTIVNLSYYFKLRSGGCATYATAESTSESVEAAVRAAFNNGIIIVVAAGNDGCNTSYYTPTRQPQAFVVGATDNSRRMLGQDAKWSFSRTGPNISAFAPGVYVDVLAHNGQFTADSGTSFAAPYIAGIFAAACQYYKPYCSIADVGSIYQEMRNFGTIGTVVNPDGTALTGATSRFISRSPW